MKAVMAGGTMTLIQDLVSDFDKFLTKAALQQIRSAADVVADMALDDSFEMGISVDTIRSNAINLLYTDGAVNDVQKQLIGLIEKRIEEVEFDITYMLQRVLSNDKFSMNCSITVYAP